MDSADTKDNAVDLRNVALLLWRRRSLVVIVSLLTAATFLAVSFVVRATYLAECTVVVTGAGGRTSPLEKLGLNLTDFGLQSFSVAGGMAAYPDILRSRSILDHLLDTRFRTSSDDSVRLFETLDTSGTPAQRRASAIEKLRDQIRTSLDLDTGILRVKVYMSDPVLAAQVANRLVANLLQYLIATSNSIAGQKANLISQRLGETEAELARREEALRRFRERNVRIANSPSLQLEEGRLLRSTREQEEVYFALYRQSELARLEERQDVAPAAILDSADVPAFRHWPRRTLLTALGLFVGFLASTIYIVFAERKHSSTAPRQVDSGNAAGLRASSGR